MDAVTALNNPLAIQRAILNDYQARLDGDHQVVDPNNTFSFLLESFGRTVAEAMTAVDTKLNGIYPKRATTTEELYSHLSQFDYVGFYSTPASLRISMMLHKNYLIKHAEEVPGTNYQLIAIPADTRLTVGRFNLGLYYPIHLRINKTTKTVSAVYDTRKLNPLHTLRTNDIPVRTSNYGGIEMVVFEFDAFQFQKHVHLETIQADLGFNRKYIHPEKFYAIRVFDTRSGAELDYTMSDIAYDPQRPTVRLRVYPEEHAISVTVPPIYFTSGKIGDQLRVEVYTTEGALDASLANLDLSDIEANFAFNSQTTELKYTRPLKNIPTIVIAPMDTRIIGGSDGGTFAQLKDRVVYRAGEEQVPVTRMALERVFEHNGFGHGLKLDNLTDRRYYAHRSLIFQERVLGTVIGKLTLTYEQAPDNSGIIYHQDGSITVLPTTVFRYGDTTKSLIPIPETAQDELGSMTPTQLAQVLNTSNYYATPHHYVINTDHRYARCTPYDLLSAEVDSITFVAENVSTSIQLTLVNLNIKHLRGGSGGYLIRAGIQRSADIADIPITDVDMFMTIPTTEQWLLGLRGEYFGTFDGIDVFDFVINTDYRLKEDRLMVTDLIRQDGQLTDYWVPLSGEIHLAGCVRKIHVSTTAQDHTIMNRVFTTEPEQWLAVSLQKFRYTLGVDLTEVLDPDLVTTWSSKQYQRHEVDVPLTYSHDVYETNPDGTLKYTIDSVTGDLVLNKIHEVGEIHTDQFGVAILKHRVGDLILDVNGNPITAAERVREFTIELPGYAYSNQHLIPEFSNKLARELTSYYNTIRTMRQNVLENTSIAFQPTITAASTTYRLNNLSTIQMTLNIRLKFVMFVPQTTLGDYSLQNTILDLVKRTVKTHLKRKLISVSQLMTEIRELLPEFVVSIDFVSLNDRTDVQTLVNLESNKEPQLGYRLDTTAEGKLTLVPELDIEFRPLDV